MILEITVKWACSRVVMTAAQPRNLIGVHAQIKCIVMYAHFKLTQLFVDNLRILF